MNYLSELVGSKKAHGEGVQFYRSGFLRLWRWRITASNGRVIGASSQGYWNRADAEDNLLTVSNSIREYYFNEKY